MKRNGMTIIELVVAFALTSVIALFLVQVVVFLKDTYVVNAVRSEIVLKQSTVSNMINELLDNNSIVSFDQNCGDNCVLITFDDNTTQEINFDVEGKRIIVGDYVSKLPNTSKIDNVEIYKQDIVGENGESNYIFVINAVITSDLFNNESFKINALYQSYFSDQDKEYVDGTGIYYDVKKGKACSNYHEDNSLTGYNGIYEGENSTATTENQNSCLKFYAFLYNEGDTEVNLLLDHNTTGKTYWTDSSTSSNANGPITVLSELKTATDSWAGTKTPANYTVIQEGYGNYTIDYSDYKARLITADEIAQITGNTSFDESTTSYSSWFYFDTNSQTSKDTCKNGDTTGCDYGWLYDRTYTSCKTYGCLNNADSGLGYWTSTSAFGYSYGAWGVYFGGLLGYYFVDFDDYLSVRPVITVLKSNL